MKTWVTYDSMQLLKLAISLLAAASGEAIVVQCRETVGGSGARRGNQW